MKKQTEQQIKQKQQMYETFGYFANGGRNAKDHVKNMPTDRVVTKDYIEGFTIKK